MLLEFISRYFKYIIIALVGTTIFKIVLSNLFNEKLRGMNGLFYAIFKWYGDYELQMEDNNQRRKVMRFHNLVTALMFFFMFLLLLIIGIRKILAH